MSGGHRCGLGAPTGLCSWTCARRRRMEWGSVQGGWRSLQRRVLKTNGVKRGKRREERMRRRRVRGEGQQILRVGYQVARVRRGGLEGGGTCVKTARHRRSGRGGEGGGLQGGWDGGEGNKVVDGCRRGGGGLLRWQARSGAASRKDLGGG
jgi:hypothetical protein